MVDRLPASLAYLLVYNPTLPPHPNASKDDEDAQEEAHVLFYTSRERAASRDRMLRQVGLAKALVNFAEIFTTDPGCDSVHSQGKRKVFVSPEPTFWMHVCIDLAKTPKQSKDKGKLPKGKGPPVPTYFYHEESLHDLALRKQLMRGYEHFKLLHGTFTSILKELGAEGLRRQLEQFFTPWAWKWDAENASEFSSHLGLPLHPLNATLAPILSSFRKNMPSNATPFLLCPPYIIDIHPSVALHPAFLPAYLLSSAHPPNPPMPRRESNKRRDSSKSTVSNNDRPDMGTNSHTFGFFSGAGAGMGEVMNVKKWSWPVALSFGKPGLASQVKHSDDVDTGASRTQIAVQRPADTISAPSVPLPDTPKAIELERNSQAVAEALGYAEGGVDQFALDDAISSADLTLRQNSMDNLVEESTGLEVETSERTPNCTANVSVVESPRRDIEATLSASETPSPPQTFAIQSSHPFSIFKVYISEPSEPLVVKRQSVLRLSRSQFVFALLMDTSWVSDEVDASLQALGDKVSGLLDDVQRAIDAESNRNASIMKPKGLPNRTKYTISLNPSIVSSSVGFSSVSSQFFECQELLARDTDTVEVFSRTATPQHWFVARRGLGFNKAGENLQGDAYLETGDKEASLVDADNELVGAVRRLVYEGE